jgi:NADPH:quinone reductase-like Zn-dependent oxidoreductase
VKAAVFEEFGGPERVEIRELEDPRPGPGEVVLKVAGSALNHLDLWVRRGLPIRTTMPHIGGSDIAGVVDEIGADVEGPGVGDRVVVDPTLGCGTCPACRADEAPLCASLRIIGEHTQGGFAEKVAVPASNLFPVPAEYPLEQAAAAPLAFLTAWRGLMTRGKLGPGEIVLVTGASGGVATAAIQIARHFGARVFALSTRSNVTRLEGLGAERVFDREDPEWGRELWQATEKRGVELIFDSVGAAIWPAILRAAAPLGRIVVYGATTGPHAQADLRFVFWRQLEILGTTMANRSEFEAAMRLVFSGAVEPVVDAVWPLERAAEAHARLEDGAQFGKIVLTP